MYKIKLWNNKYGNDAKFVVENPAGKMTEFSVGNLKDVAWTDVDLTKNPEYKGWDNWNNEQVADLNDIVM